ncbi:MAG: phosphatidylserine decarboxylase family protein [Rickettsiales bacterium]|jgi:phosphatidylserine decarboxylase|nr:phosphatidylserine decarboxylase family protein [Rickettsiales bacterium]
MSEDLKDALKRVIVPINPDGYFIIGVSVVVTFLLLLLSNFLGTVALILTAFIIYFFRNPDRVSPDDKNVVLASADGVIDKIESDVSAPKELNIDGTFQRVSIFLNTFNVHVQRVPIDGTIEKTEYVEGKFLNITNDKYHDDNERQITLMKTKDGLPVVFVQIAGFVARRIVFRLKEGQEVIAGQRFGSIKFGSRVDVYLPREVEIKVKVGQLAIGGETVIGVLK